MVKVRKYKKFKSRKIRKTHRNRKNKRTRKQKGGSLYGTGVGANCNDPNYSIYNTRELELFPYRPN